MGTCSRCNLDRELVKSRWCRECKNTYERNRRALEPDKKKKERREKNKALYYDKKETLVGPIEIPDELKTCTICKLTFPMKNFHLAKCKGTIRAMCKECSSIKRKEYYQNHKKEVNKQVTEYQIEKMKKDPIFKMERRLRCRIYHAFISQDNSKKKRTLEYLGCSIKWFQEWIEFQLYDGMTLENYGEFWHIDHVKPCISFDLSKEEQIVECFNWKNLRPLTATKNLEKNCKLLEYDILLQELKATVFLKGKNGTKKRRASVK